jgi:hypothetical protein
MNRKFMGRSFQTANWKGEQHMAHLWSPYPLDPAADYLVHFSSSPAGSLPHLLVPLPSYRCFQYV